MERLRGKEALKTYSFRDVTVGKKEALQSLTDKSRAVVASNMDVLISVVTKNTSGEQETIENLLHVKKNIEEYIPPGGLSMAESDLNLIYDSFGKRSYQEVMEIVSQDTLLKFNQMDKGEDANPGIVFMGYTLDLLRIIDPKAASFDDGVQILIDSMRKRKIDVSPFLLGAMIDDSINLRGARIVGIDFFADKEGAEQLKESYLRFADESEKKSFKVGEKVTLGELNYRIYGPSLN